MFFQKKKRDLQKTFPRIELTPGANSRSIRAGVLLFQHPNFLPIFRVVRYQLSLPLLSKKKPLILVTSERNTSVKS